MSDDKIIKLPKATKPGKPTLHLMRGDRINIETLTVTFERLTGRKATLEEIQEAKAEQHSSVGAQGSRSSHPAKRGGIDDCEGRD